MRPLFIASALQAAALVAAPSEQAVLLPAYHLAEGPLPGPDPLDAPVASYRAVRIPIAAAFLSLSRAYGITFVLDPALKGEVSMEMRNGTVRDAIDALAKSQGFYWERDGRLIAVRRNVVRFYEIDYPQMTRSAQGSSNVVLSAQAASSVNGVNGAVQNGSLSAANGSNGGNYPNQNDQTNISIQQQNQSTFWADVQSELSGLAQPGESVAVNRLAGIAVVTAPPSRQADFRAFIDIVNRRISRQVRISARVLEVELNDQHQLGVDWALAATKIGGLNLSGFATDTAFTAITGPIRR